MPIRKYEKASRRVVLRMMARKSDAARAAEQHEAGRRRRGGRRTRPKQPLSGKHPLEDDGGREPHGEERRARSASIFGASRRGYSNEGLRARSATMGRDVRFLRQAALLLPSAFLLDVLIFLLTHGRKDPGFGTYPFFQEWVGRGVGGRAGDAISAAGPGLLRAGLPGHAPLHPDASRWPSASLFGARAKRRPSAYGRAFGAAFPALFLRGQRRR